LTSLPSASRYLVIASLDCFDHRAGMRWPPVMIHASPSPTTSASGTSAPELSTRPVFRYGVNWKITLFGVIRRPWASRWRAPFWVRNQPLAPGSQSKRIGVRTCPFWRFHDPSTELTGLMPGPEGASPGAR
jgi:hypothetical protein